MSFQDVSSEQDMLSLLQSASGPTAVFFYTPFCGTCKVASRMLDVVLETMQGTNALKCNLNYAPALAERWQISSVPCLMVIESEHVINRLYAFRSVNHVYEFLLTHTS